MKINLNNCPFCQEEIYGKAVVCPHCHEVLTAEKQQENDILRSQVQGNTHSSYQRHNPYRATQNDIARIAYQISSEQLKSIFFVLLMLVVLAAVCFRWEPRGTVRDIFSDQVLTYKRDRFTGQDWSVEKHKMRRKETPVYPYDSNTVLKRRAVSLGLAVIFIFSFSSYSKSRRKLKNLLGY